VALLQLPLYVPCPLFFQFALFYLINFQFTSIVVSLQLKLHFMQPLNFQDPDSFTPPAPPPQSCYRTIWNGIIVVAKFIGESVATVALHLILVVLAQIFFPSLALPILLFAASLFVTRLVIKMLDRYDLTCLNQLKEKAGGMIKACPHYQKIGLVIILILSAIIPVVGMGCAIILGAFQGFVLGFSHVESLQKNDRMIELMSVGNGLATC